MAERVERRLTTILGPRPSRAPAGETPAVQVAPLDLPDKPETAVLQFTKMSADPEQDFLANGIGEDVITALSRYPSLLVSLLVITTISPSPLRTSGIGLPRSILLYAPTAAFSQPRCPPNVAVGRGRQRGGQ